MRVSDYELSHLILRFEQEMDMKPMHCVQNLGALRDLVFLRIEHKAALEEYRAHTAVIEAEIDRWVDRYCKLSAAADYDVKKRDDEIGLLESGHSELRRACALGWVALTAFRQQRPDDPSWTYEQKAAIAELDRTIEVMRKAIK